VALPLSRPGVKVGIVSTLAEIESAVEMLPPIEQRELFDFLASKLESQSAGESVFPDLKALLQAMPDVGEDADFRRVDESPRDVDLS
jgi:hypothetical protein